MDQSPADINDREEEEKVIEEPKPKAGKGKKKAPAVPAKSGMSLRDRMK